MRLLSCQAFGGGIGCGAPRLFYHAADLPAAAIRKHGQDGFQKKQEARQKRESKKRQRQDDAESALAALERLRAACPPAPIASPGTGAPNNANIIPVSSSNNAAPQFAAVEPPETSTLRKSLLKLAKKALGFKDSGGAKDWRIEVPGVQPSVFAALSGRPADSALQTFVKVGAYHSHEAEARELFRCTNADLVRFFTREGVGIEIFEEIILKYKPSDMTLTLLGCGEIVLE